MRRWACCHGSGAVSLATPQRVLERLHAQLLAEGTVDLDVDGRRGKDGGVEVVPVLVGDDPVDREERARHRGRHGTTTPVGHPLPLRGDGIGEREARVEEEGAGAALRRPRGRVVVVRAGAVVDRDGVHPRRHPTEPLADRQGGGDGGGDQLGHRVVAVGELDSHPMSTVDARGPQREHAASNTAAADLDAGQKLADVDRALIVA